MSVITRDPQATADTLERWLAAVPRLAEASVTNVSIPGATGWSNETILFDAAWTVDGRRTDHRLVARIAPTDHTVFPTRTFREQYAVMAALAEHSDVPMAAVRWLEPSTEWFGSEFWIMDLVEGDVPSDAPPYAGSGWLFDASTPEQTRAWWSGIEAMAQVHRLDHHQLALTATAVPAGPDPVIAQLDHYEGFLHWAEDARPHVAARRALDTLRATAPPVPVQGPSLTWGDARLSNLIYRHFEVVAVLDWEMTSIADPLLDLGWWLFADATLTHGSGCQRLAGFPGRNETADRWSDLTGRSTNELAYYELLAGFRFTVIMLRMGKLLADIGLVEPEFAYDNLVSQALVDQLD